MLDSEVVEWINHSVDEVIKKLPKFKQTEYYGIVK
jgi:predicted DNA-binding protein (MmcQ/YjbR family)